MPVDYRFKFPLPNGLHARPASHLEAVTSRFRSKVTLISERTAARANVRSVLSMISADVKFDDPVCIEVDGEDEHSALDALSKFVRDELPHCDQTLAEIPAAKIDLVLPRSLAAAGLSEFVRGRAVGGGVGQGKAFIIGGMSIPAGLDNERASDPAHERRRAADALAYVAEALKTKIETARQSSQGATEADVLKAHAAVVRDVALVDTINSLILNQRRTAAQAIVQACKSFSETLARSSSAYLRERVLDVEDICIQLLDRVVHRDHRTATNVPANVLTVPSICLADHLTPGQLLGLNRRHLKGLVLAEGGTTSHTVILARSMNIPTLVGVANAATAARAGTEVIVDGELGLLITALTEPVRRYYVMESDRLDHKRKQLDSYRHLNGMTSDGHHLEIGANIASAEEATAAFENGAQGIGLFRTEMLFMDRQSAPSELEQEKIYTSAIIAAGGKPVIIRLLDIGGDKPAPYLKLPTEENPFLGYRGARLYKEFEPLVKAQIRAILRASSHNRAGATRPGSVVQILVPMICCLEEVRDIRAMLDECAAELAEDGLVIAPLPRLGVMIEIPSLAFLMPELCQELDFFSIGSNDLTQYFLAADRANQKVASLYTWSHPAFWRMLKSVVDHAKSHGKWIGLCGELGDQPAALPLLIGLGLNEISVSPPRVGHVKAAVAQSSHARCREMLDAVLKSGTRAEVETIVQSSGDPAATAPLLSADLIFTSDAVTKHEAIKQLADRLYLAGRVAQPQLLEEAIWKREETYSTGFGFGLALPHCKSDHLTANSIAIARLTTPVDWGSLDDQKVDIVILLAIRGLEPARQHMMIFAKLSRLVMRDEFRDAVRNETDPACLVTLLQQSLGGELVQKSN